MVIVTYKKDMGSLDPRLADISVGDKFIRRLNRYSWSNITNGYEYVTLQRLADGRYFNVRMEKYLDFFEIDEPKVENDSSE